MKSDEQREKKEESPFNRKRDVYACFPLEMHGNSMLPEGMTHKNDHRWGKKSANANVKLVRRERMWAKKKRKKKSFSRIIVGRKVRRVGEYSRNLAAD